MTPLVKYVVLQLPGYGLTGLIVFALWRWVGIPAWAAWGICGLVVVKDVLLYPMVRRSFVEPPHAGAEALIGARGVAVDSLEPTGRVQLGAELWQAKAAADEAPIRAGAAVRVREVRGLTVFVQVDD